MKPQQYRVKSDDFSNHGLPIGAVVEKCAGPDWSNTHYWFTQGGDGDETAIDDRDLEKI